MADSQNNAAVLTRLPQYYRILRRFLQQGIYRCSSEEIAAQTDCSPTAVRSDLRRFSGCAKQGYGYHVKQLYTALGNYLGVLDEFRAVLVGDGAAAQVICQHPLIAVHGIRLCGVFSQTCPAPLPASQTVTGTLAELGAFCRENGVSLLLLTEPIPVHVLDEAIAGGVKGIWNLSEEKLEARDGVLIREVHPFDTLISLCCALKQGEA